MTGGLSRERLWPLSGLSLLPQKPVATQPGSSPEVSAHTPAKGPPGKACSGSEQLRPAQGRWPWDLQWPSVAAVLCGLGSPMALWAPDRLWGVGTFSTIEVCSVASPAQPGPLGCFWIRKGWCLAEPGTVRVLSWGTWRPGPCFPSSFLPQVSLVELCPALGCPVCEGGGRGWASSPGSRWLLVDFHLAGRNLPDSHSALPLQGLPR